MTGPRPEQERVIRLLQELTIDDIHRVILMLAGGGLDSYGSNVSASIDLSLDMLRHGMMAPAPPRADEADHGLPHHTAKL